jgi:Ca2+-binding RTX toxin-like protein
MGYRHALAVVTACAVAAAPLGAPALAAEAAGLTIVSGTSERERLFGTTGADLIKARQGNDRIAPRGGADRVRAGKGNDSVLLSRDGQVDRIFCGPGFDTVAYDGDVDPADVIADNCEARIA